MCIEALDWQLQEQRGQFESQLEEQRQQSEEQRQTADEQHHQSKTVVVAMSNLLAGWQPRHCGRGAGFGSGKLRCPRREGGPAREDGVMGAVGSEVKVG